MRCVQKSWLPVFRQQGFTNSVFDQKTTAWSGKTELPLDEGRLSPVVPV